VTIDKIAQDIFVRAHAIIHGFLLMDAFWTRAFVRFVASLALKFPQTDLHGP
jgi:hypothetical protein